MTATPESVPSGAVIHRHTYAGPNPHAPTPVVVCDLLIPTQLLAGYSVTIQQFLDRSPEPVARFASSDGVAPAPEISPSGLGGLLVRWACAALNHVRGHVAAFGVRCLDGTGEGSKSVNCEVWLGYHEPRITLWALRLAMDLYEGTARERLTPQHWKEALEPFWQACRQHHPDFQVGLVMTAADRRGVPYQPGWGLARHWLFGQGVRGRVMFETASTSDGWLGGHAAHSKISSKRVLTALGLPTPRHMLVEHPGALAQAARTVGFPCVTKPPDRGSGKGVVVGHRTLSDLEAGFRLAREFSDAPVMVEQWVPGDDHRLMVVDGVLRAAIRRELPKVIGDGQHSIRSLVAARDAHRDAISPKASQYLRPLLWDEACLRFLAHQGLHPEAIPGAGEVVVLRGNANLSTGGDCVDVSAQVHPSVQVMAESLARSLDVRMLGIDYQTVNPSLSPTATGGSIIEFNLTPGLNVLVAAGWSPDAAGALALGSAVGRVLVVVLVVPSDQLDQAESALETLRLPDRAAWASARKACISGLTLQGMGSFPWSPVRAVMAHRSVEQVLVLCSDVETQNWGLPLDGASVIHWVGHGPPAAWKSVWASVSSVMQRHDTLDLALEACRRGWLSA